MTTTKIVVTHGGKLRKKYKTAGWTKINAALKKLIAADAARGIATTVVALDTSRRQRRWPTSRRRSRRRSTRRLSHTTALTTSSFSAGPTWSRISRCGTRSSIPRARIGTRPCQAICRTRATRRTAPRSRTFSDRRVSSDACRICREPRSRELLVALIDLAAKATESPTAGKAFFGLSCVEWKGSTTKSLVKIFGAGSKPRLSPTEGPVWTKAALGPGWHFINCHGAPEGPAVLRTAGRGLSGLRTTRPSCR